VGHSEATPVGTAFAVETELAVETLVSPERVVEIGSLAQPRPQRVRQREQGGVVHTSLHSL
jgi:hypothetical protein